MLLPHLATAWLGFLAGLIGGAISGAAAALLAVYGNSRSRRSAEAALIGLERRSAFADAALALGSLIAASLDLRYNHPAQGSAQNEARDARLVADSARAALIDLERASAQTKDEAALKLTAFVSATYLHWRMSASAVEELTSWRDFWESCVSLKKLVQAQLQVP